LPPPPPAGGQGDLPLLAGAGDPDLGAAGEVAGAPRAGGFHGVRRARGGDRRRRPCRSEPPRLGSRAKRRPRRGSTGPDVVFLPPKVRFADARNFRTGEGRLVPARLTRSMRGSSVGRA